MTTTPLPRMPACKFKDMQYQRRYIGDVYTRDQMQAYATAARADLEAENKRLKRDAEELSFLYGDLLHWTERAVGNGNANSDIEDAWSRYEDWMKARAALENTK